MSIVEYEQTYYDSRQLESAWQLMPDGPDYTEQGETWQYMGSRVKREPTGRIVAIHTFRHRCYQGARRYVHVREDERGVDIVTTV